MGVRNSTTEGATFLYCSTTGYAIGQSFSCEQEADFFLEWFEKDWCEGSGRDLRTLDAGEVGEARQVFNRQAELFEEEGLDWYEFLAGLPLRS